MNFHPFAKVTTTTKKTHPKQPPKTPNQTKSTNFHSKWTKTVLNKKLVFCIGKPAFPQTYLSTISFRIRLARLLSTFLNIFKSFFFRGAVVGVEGLFVLLFLGAAWRTGEKKTKQKPT